MVSIVALLCTTVLLVGETPNPAQQEGKSAHEDIVGAVSRDTTYSDDDAGEAAQAAPLNADVVGQAVQGGLSMAAEETAAEVGWPPEKERSRTRATDTCPAGSIFVQNPNGSDAANSDEGGGYQIYENFSGAGDIDVVTWWSINAFYGAAGWEPCEKDPYPFEISFWNDDGSGYPDLTAAVCSYTLTPVRVNTGEMFAGTYPIWRYTAVLPSTCSMASGWVSMWGMATGQDCWFLWHSSGDGDNRCVQWNHTSGAWLADPTYDMSVCFEGAYVPTYGACCDDYTGVCTDNVEMMDCPPPLRFAADTLCDDLDPPCGNILGACCDPDTQECYPNKTEAECEALFGPGNWLEGMSCDPNPCPQANDNWENAMPIGDVTNLPFDTTDATPDGPGICMYGPNIWFCYTASCTGQATVSLCGSSYDTKLAIYDTCGQPVSYLVCNDDFCGLQSQITLQVIGGNEYLVEVGGYSSNVGPGVLSTWCDPDPTGACCLGGACIDDEYQANCESAGGTYGGDDSVCSGEDCQPNGVDDFCDLLTGTSGDCNENGIPDECEPLEDWDMNGVPDICDPDCNGNGVVDACDVSCMVGNCANHPDGCGGSEDCQPDGVPDECQLGGAARPGGYVYVWDDGSSESALGLTAGGEAAWVNHFESVPGETTIGIIQTTFGNTLSPGTSGVSAGETVRVYVWDDPMGGGDATQAVFLAEASGTADAASIDTNVFQDFAIGPVTVGASFFVGVSVVHVPGEYPMPMDTTLPFANESWAAFNVSPFDPTDMSGAINIGAVGFPNDFMVRAVSSAGVVNNDCNENGIPDDCDIMFGTSLDCQPDGIPDECQLEGNDCQGDLIPDDCQLEGNDCNEDGIPDECQLEGNDCQPDGIPDDCQLEGNDCNEDGVPDDCQLVNNDWNGNGVPDDCEPDCNENGIVDECDIEGNCGVGDCAIAPYPSGEACGESYDCQPDGVPDECQLGGGGARQLTYHVSARGLVTPPNHVYMLDADGALVGSYEQDTTCANDGWGYRDGASDGSFVYFGCGGGISRHDADGANPEQICGSAGSPGGTWRALAFDNGTLWSASWGSALVQVDMDCNQVNSFPSGGWSLYGLAYDDADGNLWGHDGLGTVIKIDTSTGTIMAGEGWPSAFPHGTAQGGLSGLHDGSGMLAAVMQSTPDLLGVYDLTGTMVIGPWDLDALTGETGSLGVAVTGGGGPGPGGGADCNGNGTPDDCDIQHCPYNHLGELIFPEALHCADCQPDGVPDGCQLGGGPPPVMTVDIYTDHFPYETTWILEEQGGPVIASGGPYFEPYTHFITEFEIDATKCYDFTIFDVYGDGQYAPWGYEISIDGNVMASTFGSGWWGYEKTESDLCPPPPPGADCNENLIPDDCEVPPICPTCPDCNEDGIPDECQLEGNDCNENLIPDDCDIADCDGSGWCTDCNENGIPDGCEGLDDCDGDGMWDICDNDCDENGTSDVCDILWCDTSLPFEEHYWCLDCQPDGVPDGYQLGGPPGPDPCIDPDAVITVEILTDNYGGETTWELLEQGIGIAASGGPYNSNTLYIIDVDVCSTSCYDFTIYDSYGDGICCTFGIGYYKVFYNGALVAEGGEFGGSETVPNIGEGCGARQRQDGCLESLFASNNNGSVGGAVYFDVTILDGALQLVTIDMNTGMTDGQAFAIEIWTTPGTYVGNEANQSVWTLMSTGTGVGVGASNGEDHVVIDTPFVLPPGTYGMALVTPTTNNYYTNGDGTNQHYENEDMMLDLGSAMNAAWSGAPFSPRVANIRICYNLGAAGCIPGEDCNENLIPDECDLMYCPPGELWCADCNEDEIPDGCQLEGNDCQGDEIPDDCQLYYTAPPPPPCTAPDAIITVEILTDYWGYETSWELEEHGVGVIATGSGYANQTFYSTDVDVCSANCYDFTINDLYGDGISSPGGYRILYNGDVVADAMGGGFTGSTETVSDIGEGCGDTGIDNDCNANEIPDECDIPPMCQAGEPGFPEECSADCQPNAIPDECEEDCNENGVPDDCDLRDCPRREGGLLDSCEGDVLPGYEWCDDCNENGIIDACDLAGGGGGGGAAIITVMILTDSWPSETTWNVAEQGGGIVGAGGPYSSAGTLYTHDVEVDSASCYDFTIYDSYGDGIYSPGGYEIYYEGDLVASTMGGGFTGSMAIVSDIGGGCASRACDAIVYDSGDCDGVNGTRPTVGWNDTGMLDDFSVPQGAGTDFSCIHMELLDFAQTDMPNMRARVYALPTNNIPVDLPNFDAATPVCDMTYSVAEGTLTIADRAPCYPTALAWDYDAEGPVCELDPGNYALLVNFPGSGAVNYWASSAPDGTSFGYVWGQQVQAPSIGSMNLAWKLLGSSGPAPPPENDCNTNGIPDECDLDCNDNGIADDCEEEPVTCGGLEIKGDACPAPFNRGSHGVTPVTLFGDMFFDVTEIDIGTIRMVRLDGEGGEVAPNEGPPGPHTALEDMGTAFYPTEPCECGPNNQHDGLLDVKMKFRTEEIVENLALVSRANGEIEEVVIIGQLCNGNWFMSPSYCLRFVPQGSGRTVNVASTEWNAYVEVTPPDITLDEGGFTSFERIYDDGTSVTLTAEPTFNGKVFGGWVVDGVLDTSGSMSISVITYQEAMTVEATYVETLRAPAPAPAPTPTPRPVPRPVSR